MQPDPIEAAAKLVSLPGSAHLCFYATSLPLTIGRGASHVQPWAAGDCVHLADDSLSLVHLIFLFDAHSRTYELRVVGRSGALIDGYEYKRSAVVRLGSGSCVKIGAQEFCVLLPQLPRGAAPPARPLPALPGAGSRAPPPLPLIAIAVQALREADGHALSLGEIEAYIRRAYPHVASSTVGARAHKAWRAALEAELRA